MITGLRPEQVAGQARPVVWLVDLVAAAAALEEVQAHFRLMPDAMAEAGQATGEQHKRLAHIALRALLAGAIGPDGARLPFEIEAQGKPRLAKEAEAGAAGHPPLSFSLAHCETAAMIGLACGGPIGVDLEFARVVRINADRRALLEAAAEAIAGGVALPIVDGADVDADARFLQAWVRLEAVAKATGEGISSLLGRIGARGRIAAPAQGSPAAATELKVVDVTPGTVLGAFAAVAYTPPPSDITAQAPVFCHLPDTLAALEGLVAGRWSPWSEYRGRGTGAG